MVIVQAQVQMLVNEFATELEYVVPMRTGKVVQPALDTARVVCAVAPPSDTCSVNPEMVTAGNPQVVPPPTKPRLA